MHLLIKDVLPPVVVIFYMSMNVQKHQCPDLKNGCPLLAVKAQKKEGSSLLIPRNQMFMGEGVGKMVIP